MSKLDQTFSALGDGTRRAILARLSQGEITLSEIAAPFEISQTAVSKHVRILADAGLVKVSKRGRSRYCSLQAQPMKEATDWLSQYQRFWHTRFAALAKHLESTP
ncbi:MAG: ArsR/SmtB family transcription factor [Burkholderiaceae bacterium]